MHEADGEPISSRKEVVLVDGSRLVLIDFPQAVDPLGHPESLVLLQRDIANVSDWFERRGVAVDRDDLFARLLTEAMG